MIDLVLLGGGGHAKSILDCLYRNNQTALNNQTIVITDPDLKEGSLVLNSKVYGSDDSLPEIYANGCRNAFISVGSIKTTNLRRKLSNYAETCGFNLIKVIDPSAVISDFSQIYEGVFVGKQAVINADSIIKKNSIINSKVLIEHECYIGEYTHIACGSILCGNVSVGNDTFVGAGTTVIEGVKIGDNVVIGAGSTILRDINDNEKVFGVVK